MSASTSMDPEQRLSRRGLELPPVSPPAGSYTPFVRTGDLLLVSGQISIGADGEVIRGRLGDSCPLEQGVRAAERAGLAALAVIRHALGTLEDVERIVKVNGYVNSSPDFRDHPRVLDGCSDLLVAVLGPRGTHARAAIGVASLPLGAAVEVECTVEVRARPRSSNETSP